MISEDGMGRQCHAFGVSGLSIKYSVCSLNNQLQRVSTFSKLCLLRDPIWRLLDYCSQFEDSNAYTVSKHRYQKWFTSVMYPVISRIL
jgi:hypothetical protein